MFRGISAINLDDKGRLAIPARHRPRLQDSAAGQLILTIDTEERCLLLYPLAEWEGIEKKLEALPSFNAEARRIQRLLMGHATDTDMDSHGRILLSPPLREYAHLSKAVVLVGQGKKFEIWDEEYWNNARDGWIASGLDKTRALPDSLESLSL